MYSNPEKMVKPLWWKVLLTLFILSFIGNLTSGEMGGTLIALILVIFLFKIGRNVERPLNNTSSYAQPRVVVAHPNSHQAGAAVQNVANTMSNLIQGAATSINNAIPTQQQPVQPASPTPDYAQRLDKAMNLEKARDFEAAAREFQEIGMYDQAARVRMTYLEKDAQTTVNIGKVGDTYVQDSVVMNGENGVPAHTSSVAINQTPQCRTCGQKVEASWNMCPNCTTPL